MRKYGLANEICLLSFLTLFLFTVASSQTKQIVKKIDKEPKTVTKLARGSFEVKTTPQTSEPESGEPTVGRLLLSKQFSGDIDGTGKGQMLGSQSAAVAGSGGYVAMEVVTGSLNGKKGSFVLQHTGTMQGGKFDLNISVVPDSGTGELTGIRGDFKIIIEGSKHLFEFNYSLPAK